jgi:hypothetical protein
MNSKKLHTTLGLILLLPLLAWSITGFVFLTKPGYEGAYEQLSVKTYPLERSIEIQSNSPWHEWRLLRTVLGYHLLVKVNGTWQHLDPDSYQRRPEPDFEALKKLLNDSLAHNPTRYGTVQSGLGGEFQTDTGIDIQFSWDNLSLRQRGRDTWVINTLYKIHYLQWLGDRELNKVFGVLGLLLLIAGSGLGFYTYLRRPR